MAQNENDTGRQAIPEYEALRAAREMAAEDTRRAIQRVARVLARAEQGSDTEQPSATAAAGQ